MDYSVDERYLVSLPAAFFTGITFPDFSKVFSGTSIKFITLFALIGSLESLLTCKAINSLDPWKRKARLDKDLLAVGSGNLLCGLIGGLPMIAEVVRSSANIHYGAKTRWGNFFHGAFLLTFVVLLTPVIKLIPNAALAGILCVVGFRLAAPRHFHYCLKVGHEQLFVFVVTVLATLLTDLLMGVFIGMVAELVAAASLGVPLSSLLSKVSCSSKGRDGRYHLTLPKACTFANVLSFKKALQSTSGQPLALDFTKTEYIDHTFMLELQSVQAEHDVIAIGRERLTPMSSHPEATCRLASSIVKGAGAASY